MERGHCAQHHHERGRPGGTYTAMVAAIPLDMLKQIVASVPAATLGQPDEIARGVAFFASDDAGFITGATLPINGRKYMA